MDQLKEIISSLKNATAAEKKLITDTYEFSKKAHSGQKRYSGEPYFEAHVVPVAKIIAELGMDGKTVAAGLLHDVLEDGHSSKENIEKEFGSEISFLVEGVTKLGKLKYRGVERHVESLRKFFVAMAADMRVLIIKLADRLHNIRTLEHVPKEKRRRIALETLEIHARLADRLGMGKLRSELEDGAFLYAYPEEYEKTKTLLKERVKVNEKDVEKIHRELQKELAAENMRDARTEHRVKHIYSLYKKLGKKDADINKVYDIVALRVIVKSVEDCYRALGLVHRLWRPLPGRIKDYIALPKPNGYQGLHTTIFTGDGGIVEIQIRTKEMHRDAEYGVASHIFYKEKKENVNGGGLGWVNELLEWQKNVSHSGEFMDHLKMDFFKFRVFVFTPEGDVIDLPDESSPVDFAYAIHSDIGDHIAGARVNGKLVPLNTPLKNGDIVEIETKKSAAPKSKWLDYAKTSVARRHIKNYLDKNNPIKNFIARKFNK